MDLQIKSSRIVLATESAVKKLNELKLAEDAAESFLRMGVKPGGCSGYSYEMYFDTEKIEAKAKCTIDYFVFKRVKNDRWSKKCISIEKI